MKETDSVLTSNWVMYLVLSAISIIALGMLHFSFTKGIRMTDYYLPLSVSSLEVDENLNSSHIWLNQIEENYKPLHEQLVWNFLNNADSLVHVFLSGGTYKGTKYLSVEDTSLVNRLIKLKSTIAEIRGLTELKIRERDNSESKEIKDKKYYEAYAKFRLEIQDYKQQLNEKRNAEYNIYKRTEYILLVIGGFLIFILFLSVVTNSKKRDQDYYVIKETNEMLLKEISERKIAKGALKISEERYRAIVENTLEGVAVIDGEFNIIYANDQVAKIMGYPIDEIVGQSFPQFLSEENQKTVVERYEKRRRGEPVPDKYELTVMQKSGDLRNIELAVSLITAPDGQVHTFAQMVDVTIRNKAEKALKESEKRFRSLMQQSPLCIQIYDTKGKLLTANDGWIKLFNVKDPAEYIGSYNIFDSENAKKMGHLDAFNKALKGVSVDIPEAVYEQIENNIVIIRKYLHSKIYPIMDDSDDVINVVVIHSDITDRKFSEDELNKKMDLEALLLDISTSFIGIPISEVDSTIETALRKVSEFLTVDSCQIFEFSSDKKTCSVTHFWQNKDLKIERGSLIKVSSESFITREILKGNVVNSYSLYRAEKEEKEKVERYLKTTGIKSFIDMPIKIQNGIGGFIGYSSLREREWNDNEIKSLKMISHIFGNTLFTKKSVTEKRDIEERYTSVFESGAMGVSFAKKDGKLIGVNPKFCEMIGYTKDELKDKTMFEITHPEDLDLSKAMMQEVWSGKSKSNRIIKRYIKKDGSVIWGSTTVSVISNEDGTFNYSVGIIEDITDRKKIEENLIQLQLGVERSDDAVFITNVEGNITYVNPAFETIYGYSKEEVIGQNPRILKSGLHPEEIYKKFWNTLLDKKVVIDQIRNKTKDGRIITLDISANPIINNENKIIGFLAIQKDITERKEIENRLQESEEKYKHLIQRSPVGILIMSQGKIVFTNPALLNTLNYSSEDEILGKPIFDFIHPDYVESAIQRFNKLTTKGGTVPAAEEKFIRKDGAIIDVLVLGQSIIYEGELAVQGYIYDITARKEVESNLILAKAKAEQADKLKSEFLAQISHEIRTPINVILSFASLLKEEVQDKIESEELASSFSVIGTAGKRLIRTIDLILNMSQLQTGTYDYEAEELDIYSDVIEKIYYEFSFLAKDKNIELKLTKVTDNNIIKIDGFTVGQIFTNLIDNAFKYTNEGSIEIKIQNNDKKLTVDIIDTGIGIAKEYLPSLFEPFTQEDKGYTRRFEGTGLGLALVKSYCDLNNAEITVESKKGKGTTFHVTFNK